MSDCPCGSGRPLSDCCAPLLEGRQAPATAEALMRSRYTAYATMAIDYLHSSLHPDHRNDHDVAATRRWAAGAQWQGLEVLNLTAGGENDDRGEVEFIAQYKDKGVTRRHHEIGLFERHEGRWYFVQGKLVPPATIQHQNKVGRNDPCPCGSGKKHKKCCGA